MWIYVTEVFMVYNSCHFVQTRLICRSDGYTRGSQMKTLKVR